MTKEIAIKTALDEYYKARKIREKVTEDFMETCQQNNDLKSFFRLQTNLVEEENRLANEFIKKISQ